MMYYMYIKQKIETWFVQKRFYLNKQVKSISANTYQLILLAVNLKTKFWVNKRLEVSLENIQLIPISIIKQN